MVIKLVFSQPNLRDVLLDFCSFLFHSNIKASLINNRLLLLSCVEYSNQVLSTLEAFFN
jgi:hypothetical protein